MFQRNGQLLYKRFAGYFLPTVIMQLALSMSMVVDGIIVGNMLGPDALAAVNLALPLTLFFSLISACFGLGGTILVAGALGRKETDAANETFSISILALIASGLLILGILIASVDPLSGILCAGNQTLYPLVREFLGVLVWGAPLLIITPGIIFFIRADGQPTLGALILVTANAINLVCDVLFIHWLNSIRGASLATVLGYAVGMLLLVKYVRSPLRMLKLKASSKGYLSRLAAIVKAGFPAAFDIFLLFLKIMCINSIVLSLSGASGMAAFSVCLSCLSLVSTFIAGGADTMIPIAGVLYGENDIHGIRLVFRRACVIIVVATIVLTILFEFFPVQLMAVFGVTDAEGIRVGVPAIRLFALSFIGIGFAYLMLAYYQTVGRPALATSLIVVEGGLVVIPAAWILSRVWGLTGVWGAFLLAEAAAALFILYATRREEKRSGGAVKGLLLLPPEMGDDGTLDLTIKNTLEEAVGLSEKIRLFCREKNVDETTAMKVALAVEEMAVNVVKHGHDSPGEHYIDVGMRLTPDEIRVSFRDDGRPFNPLAYEADGKETPMVGGLRVLKALAVAVTYTYTLNFNSTLIVVSRDNAAASA